MVTHQERENVKRAYPSKRWADKVDKMSESQIAAVTLRLRRIGKV